ncbi:MAG TPA: ATP-binding protein [Vicinamibacteria bacterium]|nr:ATP-binding protein [Vicinamibacteria bacterium]
MQSTSAGPAEAGERRSRLPELTGLPLVLRLRGGWRHLIAVVAAAAASVVQLALLPRPGIAPFVFFSAAVALASWFGGIGPGLLAVVLTAAVGNYVFLEPSPGWSTSAPELRATVLFVVAASLVAVLCASFRRSLFQLQRTAGALREVEQALRDADRRKTEFLALLSHELRNPLAPITSSLHVLEQAAPGGEQARRAREVIGRQVAQLVRMVDDLLEVTRLTRGRIKLQRRPLELRDLVRRTIEDHRSLFDGSGIGLRFEAAAGPVRVHADENRIAQVVGNLLTNAAKFTSRLGRVTVSVAADAAASRAVLRVADDGAGIAPEMLPWLFEPFTQADTTLDRSRGGLGLGLALVKGLVEQHGGTVEAASDGPGRGAVFTVRLPLAPDAAATDRPPAPPRPASRRVLVIEDGVDAAESLRELLEIEGHCVAVCYDGAAGIRKAREFRPELVLCDIGLPQMDGYEVARAFRADAQLASARLIALTGYAQPEDLERAAAAGFARHLAKPPDVTRLREVLAGL